MKYCAPRLNILEFKFFDLNPLQSRMSFKEFLYLKLDSHLPKKILLICFNDSASKLMKNAFYFILEALFVLKIFNFVLTFWACRKNGLIRKIKLISKSMTSEPGNTELQYTYCSISHKLKATRQ